MEHIFDNISPSSMTASASSMLVALGPWATLLIGILLAFFILSQVVIILREVKDAYQMDININAERKREVDDFRVDYGSSRDIEREDLSTIDVEYDIDW